MKKLSLLLLLSVFVFCGCSKDNDDLPNNDDTENGSGDSDDDKAIEYVLGLPTYDKAETIYQGDLKNPDSNGNDQYGNPYILNRISDNSKIFEFDSYSISYDGGTNFGFDSDSFAFTNGTTGNYSAVTKKGFNGKTYVVVGAAGYKEAAIRFKKHDNANTKEDYVVKGLYVTNSVYAYESMKNGAGYYGEEEIFGKDDSFKLTIYNLDKTKKVEYYLAQGTNIITEWKWVDLTSLGETEGLKFKLETTKTNEFGPLTPTYFCLDGITLIED